MACEDRVRNFNFIGDRDAVSLRAKSDRRIAEMRADGIEVGFALNNKCRNINPKHINYQVIETWDCSYQPTDEQRCLAQLDSPLLPKIEKAKMTQAEMLEAIKNESVQGFVLCAAKWEASAKM